MQPIVRLVALVALGAVLANVLRNPRGTATVFRGINGLLKTGLRGASGQKI
jgi:hypothetical protein